MNTEKILEYQQFFGDNIISPFKFIINKNELEKFIKIHGKQKAKEIILESITAFLINCL